MEKKIFFKIGLLLLVLTVTAIACDEKEETPRDEVKFENVLSGVNEVPGNTLEATGSINVTYDKNSNVLDYLITYDGITPTAMHFHKAEVGVNGDVVIGINAPFSSGITGSTVALTEEQEADLLAGLWYFNIHTAEFPGGALRGQIEEGEVVLFNNIALTGANEVPVNSSTATGIFTGSYNNETKVFYYTISFEGITPTAMHFHEGETGVPGGVVLGIDAPYVSPMTRTSVLTEEQEADMLDGLWYVNIHSADFPGGEIRGQVE